MELRDASILVAGGTGEVGGALARALASEGAEVAVAGRDTGRLSEGRREVAWDLSARQPVSR